MANGINKIILIGNLGRDVEASAMPNGDMVCTLSIATSESWKDKNTGQQMEKTEWHRVVAFKRLAEICGEYLRKGSKVYIEGRLRTRSYDKDGVKRWVTEVVAREMQMLDSQQAQQQYVPPSPAPSAAGYMSGQPPIETDDIPF